MNKLGPLVVLLTLTPCAALACRPGVDPHCAKPTNPESHHTYHRHYFYHHHDNHYFNPIKPLPAPPFQNATKSFSPASPATPLTPLRDYLSNDDIPPPDIGGYGMVVLQFKATDANRAKLGIVCRDFVSFFPKTKGSKVPAKDQMVTIWPIEADFVAEAEKDDCDFSLQHYASPLRNRRSPMRASRAPSSTARVRI